MDYKDGDIVSFQGGSQYAESLRQHYADGVISGQELFISDGYPVLVNGKHPSGNYQVSIVFDGKELLSLLPYDSLGKIYSANQSIESYGAFVQAFIADKPELALKMIDISTL